MCAGSQCHRAGHESGWKARKRRGRDVKMQRVWPRTGRLKCEYVAQAIVPNSKCPSALLYETGPRSRITSECEEMENC